MRKIIAIVALAATSAALAVDTDAGAIITDKNLSQYAKVENAANGTATVTIVDTNGTANAVTVYNKSTLDTALAGKASGSDVTALQTRATALETATNNLTTAVADKLSKSGDTMTGDLEIRDADLTVAYGSIKVERSGGDLGQVVITERTLEYNDEMKNVHSVVSFPINKTGTMALTSDIPTNFAWSAITNTPTTLAGYGITDAKIQSGTITLGSNTITPLTSYTETDPTALKPAQLKVNGTAMTTASAAVELGGYYIKTVDGKPHLFLRGN